MTNFLTPSNVMAVSIDRLAPELAAARRLGLTLNPRAGNEREDQQGHAAACRHGYSVECRHIGPAIPFAADSGVLRQQRANDFRTVVEPYIQACRMKQEPQPPSVAAPNRSAPAIGRYIHEHVLPQRRDLVARSTRHASTGIPAGE
jgi:hypothetical protein